MRFAELLGCGANRSVWALAGEPDKCVKVAHRHRSDRCIGANRLEWRVWNQARADIARWLVPCLWISEDGAYLIQRRGVPAGSVPDGAPDSIGDQRPDNWVIVDGKALMCDYSDKKTAELWGCL